MPDREKSVVACRILSYLLENRNSQDTEEGAWWWALEQEIKVKMATVERSLAVLVDQGLLVEKQGSDGKIHYALNEKERDTAEKIVQTGRMPAES